MPNPKHKHSRERRDKRRTQRSSRPPPGTSGCGNATRSSCRITPVCIAEPIRARRLSRSKSPNQVRDGAVWLCTMTLGIAQNDGCLPVASISTLLYTPAAYHVVTAALLFRPRDTSSFADYSAAYEDCA